MNRVRQKIERLTESLKTADPFKPVEVVSIQAELRVWESFAGWLGDAVQAGLTAETMIEGEEDAVDP